MSKRSYTVYASRKGENKWVVLKPIQLMTKAQAHRDADNLRRANPTLTFRVRSVSGR